MSLFHNYNNNDITRITTEYTPSGKLFAKKRDISSNLYKYFEGTTKEQNRVISTINTIFEGLFPKNSTELLEYHEKDLGIPDEIFNGVGTIRERQIDVIVKKYMMRGNRTQDFIDIANIYGVNVTIKTGLQTSVFPLSFPLFFGASFEEECNTLYITFTSDLNTLFPLPFPIQFSSATVVDKIKKIYNIIKPATTRIIYT